MAILTVSREYGSGGREIGKAVAETLDYEYIDKEKILADIGANGKKWEEWGKNLDEHCPTVWEKYDWSFRGFAALLQSHILNYAVKDRVVIMGRGGNFLLKGISHALSIGVTAPLDKRVERIMKSETVDAETARWLIKKTDNERACFIQAVYGKPWDDRAEYDMNFDTGAKTVHEIILIVKDGLLEKEKFNTEESGREIRMRAIAANVKAGILADTRFFVPTLDVYYDGKSLVLRGMIHDPKEHKALEKEARKLAEDVPIKSELHYRR